MKAPHFESIRTPRPTEDHINRILSERDKSGAVLEMSDFRGVYTDEKILADQERLRLVRLDFARNLEELSLENRQKVIDGKRRSEALETAIADNIEKRNWFGADAMISQTTPFDDVIHGVDAVLEFERKEDVTRRVALGLDVSMNANKEREVLEDKMWRSWQRVISPNGYSKVEYFKSQVDDFVGRLERVVPVVIGIDGEHCNDFLRSYADYLDLSSKRKDELTPFELTRLASQRKKLEESPIQEALLEEIRMQLELYLALLDKAGGKGNVDWEDVVRLLDITKEVMGARKMKANEIIYQDKVFEVIINETHQAMENIDNTYERLIKGERRR